MTTDLTALLANARWMPAQERAEVADGWAELQPDGSLLLATCHRVELYGTAETLRDLGAALPPGIRELTGTDAARHLVRVAVGRDSSVVAEDQILHQLRRATADARARGALPAQLDRLLDAALRAGRRARSWLPARRPSLVDLALSRTVDDLDLRGARVLVVGAGEMGTAAVANLTGRGATVIVSSRSAENARAVAMRFGATAADFDPGHVSFAGIAGVVVALKGQWSIGLESLRALLDGTAWVIDLSSPPAVSGEVVSGLGERLLTIDDLAVPHTDNGHDRLLARLDSLVDETVAAFGQWTSAEAGRTAADALTSRARDVRAAEIERLLRRVPSLDEQARAEVERALDHVTALLLRDPLEQLSRDDSGTSARAVRELFRL